MRTFIFLLLASCFLLGCGGTSKQAAKSGAAGLKPDAASAQASAFTDSRDNKKYKTTKIGGQIWMAENLNFAAEGSRCYEDKPENCEKYGRLYTWDAAAKACPSGWRLPSKEEMELLGRYVERGIIGVAENKLKAESFGGLDNYGFSALLGGKYNTRVSSSHFASINEAGFWWTSVTQSELAEFWGFSGSLLYHYASKTDLFSVRCINDKSSAVEPEIIIFDPAAVQKGSFTDPRDNKNYKTIKIDKQTWMAENLNFAAEGSRCYEDKSENCEKYGRLYTWDVAMNACPNGWHLPSREEFEDLLIGVGIKEAGIKLKAKSGWEAPEIRNHKPGTDDYGFAALPGGYYIIATASPSRFSSIDKAGYWWSSTVHIDKVNPSDNRALGLNIQISDWQVSITNHMKTYLLSARCLQN